MVNIIANTKYKVELSIKWENPENQFSIEIDKSSGLVMLFDERSFEDNGVLLVWSDESDGNIFNQLYNAFNELNEYIKRTY